MSSDYLYYGPWKLRCKGTFPQLIVIYVLLMCLWRKEVLTSGHTSSEDNTTLKINKSFINNSWTVHGPWQNSFFNNYYIVCTKNGGTSNVTWRYTSYKFFIHTKTHLCLLKTKEGRRLTQVVKTRVPFPYRRHSLIYTTSTDSHWELYTKSPIPPNIPSNLSSVVSNLNYRFLTLR